MTPAAWDPGARIFAAPVGATALRRADYSELGSVDRSSASS